jgi:hypothetical protein
LRHSPHRPAIIPGALAEALTTNSGTLGDGVSLRRRTATSFTSRGRSDVRVAGSPFAPQIRIDPGKC